MSLTIDDIKRAVRQALDERQPQSKSIPQFCAAHGVGRQAFYDMEKAGKAPRTFNVGRSVRISTAAEAEWVRDRENDGATTFFHVLD